VSVLDDRLRFQARCERCGWHSYPVQFAKQAELWDEAHAPVCPNPKPPRSGALAECGCWSHAAPGMAAGESYDTCPLHGRTLLVRMNVPEPVGEATSLQWTRGSDDV